MVTWVAFSITQIGTSPFHYVLAPEGIARLGALIREIFWGSEAGVRGNLLLWDAAVAGFLPNIPRR